MLTALTLLQPALAQQPSAPPRPEYTGAVGGRIDVADGKLPELLVYLEPLKAGRRFPPPPPISIRQAGARFDPPFAAVCIGQTVEFPNDEQRLVRHNVFSKSPAKSFDLGLYSPGVSKSVRFDSLGPVRLHCSIHREMNGTIFVAPTPFFTFAKDNGEFVIEGVAPGDYELRTFQPRKRFLESALPVRVRADETSQVVVELRRS